MSGKRKVGVRDTHGRRYTLGKPLGSGGQAEVFAVEGKKDLAAKIYRSAPGPIERAKLEWMIAHPPASPGLPGVLIAWPQDLLLDDHGRLIGILLPRVEHGVPLITAFNPRLRAQKLPHYQRAQLLLVAQRLATLVETMHHSGYVIGDLNESNVLISSKGEVVLIDTDSVQVRALRDGKVITYRSPVGKPDYTAPEIQSVSFHTVDRSFEHDRFALAVLIFQLLMDGRHPYAGRWLGNDDAPPLEKSIRQGHFPYSRPSAVMQPPPQAPTLASLEPGLAALFERAFGATTISFLNRPSGEEWAVLLSRTTPTAPIRLARPHAAANKGKPASKASKGNGSATAATTRPGGAPPPPFTPAGEPAPAAPLHARSPQAPQAAPKGRTSRRKALWIILGVIALWIILSTTNGPQPSRSRFAPPSSWLGVTQTPVNLPGGAVDPDLATFIDDFTTPDSEQEVSDPEFIADVADGAMNLSVLAPGVSDEIRYDWVEAPGDFTFTLDVGSVSGDGEILASVRETSDNASWRFAVNPASQTWRLDRESTFGNGYYVWVMPREYGARMPADLSTITIERQRDDLTFLLNGVDVVNPVNTPLPEVAGPVTVGFGAGTQPGSESRAFSVAIDRVSLSDRA
jgi:serine/threonine protein kinase